MRHLNITQAGIVSLLTTTVGQIVAFVPSFATDKQIVLSAGSAVIGAAFLVANAIHALAAKQSVPAVGHLLSTPPAAGAATPPKA